MYLRAHAISATRDALGFNLGGHSHPSASFQFQKTQVSLFPNRILLKRDQGRNSKAIKNKKYHIEELIDGKHLHYPLHKFKNKLFDSGYVPKVCGSCGFSEARITDGKMPLLIDFLDGNLNNRKLDNIRPLCYNCFFLLVGDRNVKNWYAENGGQITEDEEKNLQKQSSIQD